MAVRIDQLDPTLYPSLEHFFAAMRDGQTVRLSVQQVSDLVIADLTKTAPEALDAWLELVAQIQENDEGLDVLLAALAFKAPLADPALTGTPTVPTATPGTNTTQIASTAFVQAGLATRKLLADVAFQASRTTGWTSTAAARSLIPGLNVAGINVGGGYSTGTGRFTAPKAGIYLFQVSFSSGATASGGAYSGVGLDVNGIAARNSGFNGWTSGEYVNRSLVALLVLNAGDYVQPTYEIAAAVPVSGGGWF